MPHGVGLSSGPDFEAAGVRVEVGEVAEAGRLGVRGGHITEGEVVGEVGGIVRVAAGRQEYSRRHQQQPREFECRTNRQSVPRPLAKPDHPRFPIAQGMESPRV